MTDFKKARLFLVSSLALTMAGVGSALRANTASDLQRVFFDPIDKAHSGEMIANVLGLPFLGFAFTIAIGSPLLDYVGMGFLLPLSGVCFTAGALIMMFAGSIADGPGVYTVIWIGALITGVGWGLVETVVNPLIASLYPEDKTGKLNTLHAWWPGGLVIGGLMGVAMSAAGLGWQAKLFVVILPAFAVIALSAGVRFPPTERAAAGVSMGGMFRELLNPLFVVLFCSMFLTAASELAPGQWVDFALSRTVHMPGILLLVYVSALMFVMRHFAGPLVHKLSPIGLLWVSCLMASAGLVALAAADSPITGLLAATIWGTGVCYMWPTMLATAPSSSACSASRRRRRFARSRSCPRRCSWCSARSGCTIAGAADSVRRGSTSEVSRGVVARRSQQHRGPARRPGQARGRAGEHRRGGRARPPQLGDRDQLPVPARRPELRALADRRGRGAEHAPGRAEGRFRGRGRRGRAGDIRAGARRTLRAHDRRVVPRRGRVGVRLRPVGDGPVLLSW
jgi:MFS family permease